MSVRLTRAALRSAALRNLQASSALRVSRRMTSTSSHGATHSSSDKPWIVSLLLRERHSFRILKSLLLVDWVVIDLWSCCKFRSSTMGPTLLTPILQQLPSSSQFLYLISPSARKSHHAEHHDTEHKGKHDLPVLMHDEHSKVEKDTHATSESSTTEQPDLVKDDEGTVTNVAPSVSLSEVRCLLMFCYTCPLNCHIYGGK